MKPRMSLFIIVTMIFLLLQGCSSIAITQAVPTEVAEVAPAVGATTTQSVPSPTNVPPPVTTEVSKAVLPVVAAPQLTSIHFFDESNGWGMSANAILSTADGGKTWLNITPQAVFSEGGAAPTTYFFDSLHGWAAVPSFADPMAPSKLYLTTDGGVTWTTSTLASGMGGNFSFINPTTGFYMASLGVGAGSNWIAIYSTTDGGLTWKPGFAHQPSMGENPGDLPAGGIKSGISFLDATHGWITGNIPMDNYIYLYASADGGNTWKEQSVSTPSDLGTVFAGTYPPRFFGNTGVMPVTLVGNVINLAIYMSNDSGVTWKAAPGFVANAGRGELVDFVSPTDGFAWATGRFAVTHDGAKTWGTVTPSVAFGDNMAALDFVNPTTGWVLTMDATGHTAFYKSTDGGTTWTTLIP